MTSGSPSPRWTSRNGSSVPVVLTCVRTTFLVTMRPPVSTAFGRSRWRSEVVTVRSRRTSARPAARARIARAGISWVAPCGSVTTSALPVGATARAMRRSLSFGANAGYTRTARTPAPRARSGAPRPRRRGSRAPGRGAGRRRGGGPDRRAPGPSPGRPGSGPRGGRGGGRRRSAPRDSTLASAPRPGQRAQGRRSRCAPPVPLRASGARSAHI